MPFKIGITGPESTGKSMLAEQLSAHFKTTFVREIARKYLESLDRAYVEEDLKQIAVLQCKEEDRIANLAEEILVCDTTLQVIKIWSEVKYKRCHPDILEEEKNRKYDLFLLMNIDLPWMPDPQREHPDLRQYLFELYHQDLIEKNCPFEIISGSGEQRFQNALKALMKYKTVNDINQNKY
jgi:NadR type nicotinamide-nucleotide adenylyltransferase